MTMQARLLNFAQGHQLDAKAIAELAGHRDRFLREPSVGMRINYLP